MRVLSSGRLASRRCEEPMIGMQRDRFSSDDQSQDLRHPLGRGAGAALDAGADYVGLVFFPPSPRYLTPGRRSASGACRCAVDAQRRPGRRCRRRPARRDRPRVSRPISSSCTARKRRSASRRSRRATGRPSSRPSASPAAPMPSAPRSTAPHVALILFDAKPPKDGPLPGGNGVAFDWRHLETVKHEHPFMLSGGLTPDNVAAAIALDRRRHRRCLLGRRDQPRRKIARPDPCLYRGGKGCGRETVICAGLRIAI